MFVTTLFPGDTFTERKRYCRQGSDQHCRDTRTSVRYVSCNCEVSLG